MSKGKMKIDSKHKQFILSAKIQMGIGVNELASEVLRKSRQNAPFDKGGLRANADITREGTIGARINYRQEYAGAQEAGQANGRVFRNYTTAGTGAHYLENAGNEVSKNAGRILAKYGKRA